MYACILTVLTNRHLLLSNKSFQFFGVTTVFLLFPSVALIVPAQAQVAPSQITQVAPSQITPESLRPTPLSSGTGVLIPGSQGLTPPTGSEKLSVRVGQVRVEGDFPDLSDTVRQLVGPVEGKTVSAADIYTLGNRIEQAYAEAGYVLARIVIPPQQLTNGGVLRFVVVDGYIEGIITDGVAPRVREAVFARTSMLIGARHIKLADIERHLLIAGGVPGLQLKSTLRKGKQDGGAELVLEGDHRLASASVSIDNRLGPTLGWWQGLANLAINAPFGLGEQFYGTVGSGLDLGRAFTGDYRSRLAGGGVVIPLGNDGLSLNLEYVRSQTQPTPEQGVPPSIGTFERFAARGSYAFIRTRSQSLAVDVALEQIEQKSEAVGFATELNLDRYVALRAGVSYGGLLPTGAFVQVAAIFSQGLGGRDPGAAAVVPLSRQFAGPNFSKISGDLAVSQPLPYSLTADFKARGQYAFNQALLVSERFSLDGTDAVAGFNAGALAVDQGFTVRGELARPISLADVGFATVISPYLLATAGAGQVVRPTVVERDIVRAAAFGAGVRLSASTENGRSAALIGFEVARQFSNLNNLATGWRGTLTSSFRF